MDNEQSQLNPLTGFWCLPAGNLTDVDREIVTDLYLPLVGTTAYGIYNLLWQLHSQNELISERKSHSVLFSLLNVDTQAFVRERQKLEAVSLLKSYQKSDELGDFMIYQLFEPEKPDRFFHDDILSVFLLEKVGETQLNRLVDKYQQSTDLLKDSTEVSKKFTEVFKLYDEDLLDKPSIINDVQRQFESTPSIDQMQIQPSSLSEFDFQMVEDRVVQLFGLSQGDVMKNQQVILSLHEFYGISEVSMIDVIGKSVNIANNTIDDQMLKRIVQQRFEMKTDTSARVAQSTTEVKPVNSNDPNAALLNRANSTVPADFLAEEKSQRGGFVGVSESRALRTIASRSLLPNPVLNIMVHYILESNSTLSLAYMETVANDWKQQGIMTADDALKRINDFKNRPKKSNSKRRYNNNQPRKVEQATDWSKVQSKSANTVDDKKAEQARQEMLRKMRNKDNQ